MPECMQLTTPVKTLETPTITHASRIMMLGSCFATCLAERLLRLSFHTVVNPFGISYNPISIAQQLNRMVTGKKYEAAELGVNEGLFYSKDHHGSFSAPTVEQTLQNINTAFAEASEFLKSATHILITLGSSVIYEQPPVETTHASSLRIVWNNCHKLPQTLFAKRQLTVAEVVNALSPIISDFRDKRFILTVSPVRYLSDNNSVNKATLLLAVNELKARHANVTYFPAYEIMMDELRDYRFYDNDMIHPSTLAGQIIFDRFAQTFFTENTRSLNLQIAKLTAMQNHRPLHPDSPEYERFKLKLTEYEKNVAHALTRSRCADDDCPDTE